MRRRPSTLTTLRLLPIKKGTGGKTASLFACAKVINGHVVYLRYGKVKRTRGIAVIPRFLLRGKSKKGELKKIIKNAGKSSNFLHFLVETKGL